MNNYEFYSNLQKYQDNDIEHGLGTKIANGLNSAYNWAKEKVTGKSDFQPTYYQKIDNFYGPGKARYFYTKEEWDAHQRELQGYRERADQDVAKRDMAIRSRESQQQGAANAARDRAAKESTVANAQKYKRETELATQRKAAMQNAQASREAAMRSGQQSTKSEMEWRKKQRDINLSRQQDRRNRSIDKGQESAQQQAEIEKQRRDNYNKNAAAAGQAEANRAHNEGEAVRAEKRRKASESGNKNQKVQEAADAVIKDIKNRSDNIIKAEMRGNEAAEIQAYAQKYNVEPDELSMVLFEKTGWLSMADVDKAINRKKKG